MGSQAAAPAETNAYNSFEAAAEKEKEETSQAKQKASEPATTGEEASTEAPAPQPVSEETEENRRPVSDATEPSESERAEQEWRDAEPNEDAPEGDLSPEGQDLEGDDAAATTDAPEASNEGEDSAPFRYIGPKDFDEDEEEYVFVSAVDPKTRYKDVPSLVEGVENQIRHIRQIQSENQDYKQRLVEAQSQKASTEEELQSKVAFYEDHLGDDLEQVLTSRYMETEYPEFAGLDRSDIEDPDDLVRYGEARAMARQKAENQIAEREKQMEDRRKEREKREEERLNRINAAKDWVEDVRANKSDRFDLPEEDVQTLLPEVMDEMQTTIEGPNGEVAVDPFFLAQRQVAQGNEKEAEMILELVGLKMQRLKDQRRKAVEERMSKRTYRKPKPQPREEPAKKESPIGDPFASFEDAARANPNLRKR